jgi:hypothetical protein
VIACLAHNLARWTDTLGLSDPTPQTTRTLRYRLFTLPERVMPPTEGTTALSHAGFNRRSTRLCPL